MHKKNENINLPKWMDKESIDTVIVGFCDMYGRLMGKRMTYDYFIAQVLEAGTHVCDYLLTVDIEMNPLPGFELSNWDKGYGDFHIAVDLATFKKPEWLEKTAIVLGDLHTSDGKVVGQSPRQVLRQQLEKLEQKGLVAFMGSELEFYLFSETYDDITKKGFRDLIQASNYLIDYHILQTDQDEDVLGKLRNQMSESGITVECSKGEWGRGQHEVNLLYCEAMEMADRHILYKTGAKQIATQHGKAISFMSKLATDQAGNSFHLHSSIWDKQSNTNVFWDEKKNCPSELFRQYVGGLLKYSKELCYFFAPTINSYKRYQHSSWAPTAIVCGLDNRTCGFRIVGTGNSLRVENRMPCADANPYLAFAATLAAGVAGVEEKLDCGDIYEGNAYEDSSLSRLPKTLEEAASLLETSDFAKNVFGTDVVDYYVHTAKSEIKAFNEAVTDWERKRYFEQL